ncbi:hypothetical protein QE386_003172 [Pseudoxanthomonas winnipegensis]|nr:hypothetical protein [Pseudoxanthomonas winnipegensis]
MEGVELVHRHRVEQAFDLFHALEMAHRIEHQPAPLQPRRIGDVHRGQAGGALAGRQQLPQADAAVEQAGAVGGADADALGRDLQAVALGRAGGRIEHELDRGLRRLAFLGQFQRRAAAVVQQVDELLGRLARGLALRPDPHAGGQGEAALAGYGRLRGGNQRQRRGQRGGRDHGQQQGGGAQDRTKTAGQGHLLNTSCVTWDRAGARSAEK